MIRHRSLVLLIACIFYPLLSPAQDSLNRINFPDIPRYRTLICDMHMHSVFSDGLVWPTVRVDEAVAEGLDVIALTDHIEYRPHAKDIIADHNRSYELAKPYADKKGIILIKGSEITRSMPPGHFNVLFIKDSNPLDTADWKEAIRIAHAQGGVVIWNHPGWRQEEEIPIWYEEHSWLLSEALVQGLEIVNERSYYPLAHQWSIDSGLALIGNSDIHDPLDRFYKKCQGEHRALTIIFAADTSMKSIREAILAKRTAVYHKDRLMGDKKHMNALFMSAVDMLEMITPGGSPNTETHWNNRSSFTFYLSRSPDPEDTADLVRISPGINILTDPPKLNEDEWYVSNILVAPGKTLKIEM